MISKPMKGRGSTEPFHRFTFRAWQIDLFKKQNSCSSELLSNKREWFICLQLTDKQIIITQQCTHYSWSVSILTHKKRRKSSLSFIFCQLSAIALKKSRQSFDCNASVCMYFFRLKRAETTLHCLTSRRHVRWEGWRHKTALNNVTYFRPVNCCRF